MPQLRAGPHRGREGAAAANTLGERGRSDTLFTMCRPACLPTNQALRACWRMPVRKFSGIAIPCSGAAAAAEHGMALPENFRHARRTNTCVFRSAPAHQSRSSQCRFTTNRQSPSTTSRDAGGESDSAPAHQSRSASYLRPGGPGSASHTAPSSKTAFARHATEGCPADP